MKIKLQNVRLSFPDLFVPRAFKPGDEPKYKATFLVPQDDPQVKVIEAKILKVVTEFLKGDAKKAEKTINLIRGNANKFCWQDGDNRTYDGYDGMMALSAKNSVRPSVFDQLLSPLTKADGKPYAGCYVNASVDIFAYDSSGIGVSASLRGVQFARDGDAFAAGRPADSSEFEVIEEGSDAGDFA